MTGLLQKQFTATVIFSGDCDPDTAAASVALQACGFEVKRMPEEYRPKLCFAGDDFFVVSKSYDDIGNDDLISDEMGRSLEDIVSPLGAIADDIGPGATTYFERLFTEKG